MGVRLLIRCADGRQLEDEIEYVFEQSRLVIGRGAGADVRIPHRTVSELHAIIEQDAHGYVLVDQDSTNGTRVNAERVVAGRRCQLGHGDRIEVGVYLLLFQTGLVVTEPITAERTSELARRLLRAQRSPQSGGPGRPRLVIIEGKQVGRSVDLPPAPSRLLVGRDEACQLALDDEDVSREHMEVVRDLDGVAIRDLDSKNGILLGDQPVASRRLHDGDELCLGNTRLLFEEPAQESIAAMAEEPDVPLSRDYRAAPPPPPPEGDDEQPEPPAPTASSAAPAQRVLDADLIIYALAALVLILSISGLVVLMRAG